jgi:hypothetical protein
VSDDTYELPGDAPPGSLAAEMLSQLDLWVRRQVAEGRAAVICPAHGTPCEFVHGHYECRYCGGRVIVSCCEGAPL